MKKNHALGECFITPNEKDIPIVFPFIKKLSSEEHIFLKVAELLSPFAKPLECYDNVKHFVMQNKGTQQLGWIIWLDSLNRVIKAEAHSVLKDSNGNLIDVTPQMDDNDKTILFLPDNTLIDDGRMIPSKYFALRNTKDVLDFIKFAKSLDEMHQIAYDMRLQRQNSSTTNFYSPKKKIGRNELCPCNSGIKFKKCCGAKK